MRTRVCTRSSLRRGSTPLPAMSVSLFALEIEIRVGGGHGQNLVCDLLPVLPINEPQQDGAGLGDLVEEFRAQFLRCVAVVVHDDMTQPFGSGEPEGRGDGIEPSG